MRYEAGTKEKEEEKTPQVQEWLDETEKTIHILDENISELLMRLSDVLRREELPKETPAGNLKIEIDLVPVASRIRSLKCQVEQCRYSINSIMDRLEV